MTKHDLRIVLTLFEHYYILVCPISESMPKSLALQQKYASLFHIKKCSTQYVAHFMWVTNSLKIREYATICSTLYVLPLCFIAESYTLCQRVRFSISSQQTGQRQVLIQKKSAQYSQTYQRQQSNFPIQVLYMKISNQLVNNEDKQNGQVFPL